MDDNTRQAMRQWTLAQPVVSAYVTSVVRDFRDRDDVLQEVAIAVIESFPTYDPSRPFNGWAIGVARNKIGTYLRERRRSRLVFDDETVELLATAFEKISPERVQQLDYLHDCMGTLEGRARKLCELRYESDLKPAMIAGLVGMTANTVAKSLQRIREQLRSCVERKAALDGARR
ncbi:MAG: sigma-70 family RNA polymerase sigma factor [Planctomycetota bacterium]|nr:sigma-70 family RNA polymerase sigma factor [Planctomycetota bacterium]